MAAPISSDWIATAEFAGFGAQKNGGGLEGPSAIAMAREGGPMSSFAPLSADCLILPATHRRLVPAGRGR